MDGVRKTSLRTSGATTEFESELTSFDSPRRAFHLPYTNDPGRHFIKMSKSPWSDIKAPYNVDFHLFRTRAHNYLSGNAPN